MPSTFSRPPWRGSRLESVAVWCLPFNPQSSIRNPKSPCSFIGALRAGFRVLCSAFCILRSALPFPVPFGPLWGPCSLWTPLGSMFPLDPFGVHVPFGPLWGRARIPNAVLCVLWWVCGLCRAFCLSFPLLRFLVVAQRRPARGGFPVRPSSFEKILDILVPHRHNEPDTGRGSSGPSATRSVMGAPEFTGLRAGRGPCSPRAKAGAPDLVFPDFARRGGLWRSRLVAKGRFAALCFACAASCGLRSGLLLLCEVAMLLRYEA